MIFIGGIDGVGKSFFCNYAREQLALNYYSASKLILKRKGGLSARISDVSDMELNQSFLIEEVNQINQRENQYLLDGHFCLLSTNNQVFSIALDTFLQISPHVIVLLRDDVSTIFKRLQERKNIVYPEKLLDDFQNNETQRAIYISKELSIPIHFVDGVNDYNKAIDQLKKVV